jgi:hypothetical protein
MANFNFDASTVAPDSGQPDPVPLGWYDIALVESEIKPTAAGTGVRMAAVYQILTGQYQGRKIFGGFNLENPNPEAVKISAAQLSALSHAVGVLKWNDSSMLHNIPFKAKVKIKAGDANNGPANDIAAYKHVSDPSAGSTTGAAAPAAAGAPKTFTPPPAATGFVPPGAAATMPAVQQTWQQPAAAQPWQAPAAAAAAQVAAPVDQAAAFAAFQAQQAAQAAAAAPVVDPAAAFAAEQAAAFAAFQAQQAQVASAVQSAATTQPAWANTQVVAQNAGAPVEQTTPVQQASQTTGQAVPPWLAGAAG